MAALDADKSSAAGAGDNSEELILELFDVLERCPAAARDAATDAALEAIAAAAAPEEPEEQVPEAVKSEPSSAAEAVLQTIDYDALLNSTDEKAVEAAVASAFGPNGLGVLAVTTVPAALTAKRRRLLRLGQKLGTLPDDVLKQYERPELCYCAGWSRGREKFRGQLDVAKGSWYANGLHSHIDDARSPRALPRVDDRTAVAVAGPARRLARGRLSGPVAGPARAVAARAAALRRRRRASAQRARRGLRDDAVGRRRPVAPPRRAAAPLLPARRVRHLVRLAQRQLDHHGARAGPLLRRGGQRGSRPPGAGLTACRGPAPSTASRRRAGRCCSRSARRPRSSRPGRSWRRPTPSHAGELAPRLPEAASRSSSSRPGTSPSTCRGLRARRALADYGERSRAAQRAPLPVAAPGSSPTTARRRRLCCGNTKWSCRRRLGDRRVDLRTEFGRLGQLGAVRAVLLVGRRSRVPGLPRGRFDADRTGLGGRARLRLRRPRGASRRGPLERRVRGRRAAAPSRAAPASAARSGSPSPRVDRQTRPPTAPAAP